MAGRTSPVPATPPPVLSAKEITVVAAGGMLGASLRYALALAIPWSSPGFPWATCLTNIVGALLLGLISRRLLSLTVHPLLAPFLLVGLLGSFTTFSTFAVDFWSLWFGQAQLTAIAYVAATLAGGLTAVALAESSTRPMDQGAAR